MHASSSLIFSIVGGCVNYKTGQNRLTNNFAAVNLSKLMYDINIQFIVAHLRWRETSDVVTPKSFSSKIRSRAVYQHRTVQPRAIGAIKHIDISRKKKDFIILIKAFYTGKGS